MLERILAVVGLASVVFVGLAVTGALSPPQTADATQYQYCGAQYQYIPCAPLVPPLIAFSSNRDTLGTANSEIYIMNADGTGLARLFANSNALDTAPSWSPDGQKLAFETNRNGNEEIYVMSVYGSTQIRLTFNSAQDALPAWSPDGSKIVFESTRDGGVFQLWMMNADGSAQTRLTTTTGFDGVPSWSPDGAKIAFTSTRDGNTEIYAINADGSDQTRLTNDPASDNYAAWSPDGSKIAFASARDGNFEIYVMNADGSDQTRLTNNAAAETQPTWSPDGAKIAFTSNRDGNNEIYVMDADGSGQSRLTNDAGSDTDPDWQRSTATAQSDTIPPTISSTQSPSPNANGWNNSNVTATFTATDNPNGSEVLSTTCTVGAAAPTTVNGPTRTFLFTANVNTTISCTAKDNEGNVSDPATRTIRRDQTPPTITLQSRTPAPDLYGWNNTDVTVVWSCADAFSGVVAPSVTRTVTTNGTNQSALGTCTDLAGNNANNTQVNINIDKTAVPPTGGPPNDNIANATVVPSLPFSDAADATNATRETHEPSCFFPPDDKTVWYRLTAGQAGLTRVSVSGSFLSTPVISVWRSFSTGLQLVSCAPFTSNTFPAQSGVTYYVKIGSTTAVGVPFSVAFDLITPPANDAFENAKAVGPLPYADPVDLTAATVQTGEPRSPSGVFSPLAATAWYTFAPARDEQVVFGGTTAGFPPVALTVYTGSSIGGLTQVAGSTGTFFGGGGANFLSPVIFQAVAGTIYHVQLGLSFVSANNDNRFTFRVERPIVFDGQTPAPNANGWNDSDVTLTWHCSSLFMISNPPPPVTQTLTAEGANQSATGFCFGAGTVSDTQSGINIDKTAPTISFPHGPFAPASGGAAPPGATTVDCASNPAALGWALASAADGDVLAVEGTCHGTFDIAHSLTVVGVGAAVLDGQGLGTVVTLDPGNTVLIRDLTVTGGSLLYNGGGIANNGGTLTLENSTITGNHVLSGDGGGIYNAGTLTLKRSVVSGNTAWAHGGGIANDSPGTLVVKNSTVRDNSSGFAGGGIFSFGRLTVDGTTVAGNEGSVPYFSIDGAGIWTSGQATIRNSTISDNTATGNGGGIMNSANLSLVNSTVAANTATYSGGGVYTSGGGTGIVNTSIVGNTSSVGGGIYQGGASLDVRSSTIAGNIATNSGGGIAVGFGFGTTLSSTLLAGNGGGSCGLGFGTPLTDGGGNLDDGASCGFGPGSLSNSDPLLDAAGLQDNGGPTKTVALGAGSPAIDAIPTGTSGCGTTLVADQRGAPRPQGAGCDIGAFESGRTAPPAALVPEPNANGWNNSDVALTWTCDDALSGVVESRVTRTVTSEGADQSVMATCSDLADNSSSDTEDVSLDKTPPNAPTAAAGRAPDYGANWYRDTVTVSFTDNGDPNGANGTPGSGVDPSSAPPPVTFTTGGSHTASGTVRDLAGNESATGSLTVQVDATAPELTATFTNADGSSYTPGTWTNQAVTVTFHCTDAGGSGVASTSLPQTVVTQGANQAVVGSCTDNVGHTTTQAFGGIDIDLTPPEGYMVFDPASHDLQVFGRDQGGSGISSAPFVPTTVPGKGSAENRTYILTDGAGNQLVLALEVKPGSGAIKASVTSLRYNAGATMTAPFNRLAYTWDLNKDGSFKRLEQDLVVGKGASQQHVDAVYDGKKDETTIGSSAFPGLVLVRVATSDGTLVIEY